MRCKICDCITENLDYCNKCNSVVTNTVYEDKPERLQGGEVPHQLDLEDWLEENPHGH